LQANTAELSKLSQHLANRNKAEKEKENANKFNQRIISANTTALKSLTYKIINSQNVTDKLTEAIKVADTNTVKSLSMGINYQKFLDANTQALNETEASRRETTAALIDGFDKGLNTNSGAVMDLTERMLLTGQDTKKLNSINAELMAITGRNESVIQAASKATFDSSNRYKISSDRLIDTMQAMSEVFEEASFFGGDTVGSLDAISKELTGMVGVDMGGQISGFLKTLTPSLDNIATQSLLGAENVTKKIAEGTASTSDLMPILRRIQEISDQALQSNPPAVARTIAAAQLGMSERQLNQSLQLARAVANPREVDESIAASNEEMAETLKTAQEKANDFYDRLAPSMNNFLATIAPTALEIARVVNIIAAAGGAAQGAEGMLAGRGGMLGKLGGILGKVAMFAGPIGLAVGAFTTFAPMIADMVSSNKKQTKAIEEQNRIAKEEERQKRIADSKAQASNIQILANYAISNSSVEIRNQREVVEIMRNLLTTAQKAVDQASAPKKPEDK
jgi:hypothetical protein